MLDVHRAEDKKRWQADLDKFPDFKALIEKRAAAKAAAKQKAAAKRKSKAVDPGLTAAASEAVQATKAAKKRSQARPIGRKPPAHKSKAGKAAKGNVAKAPATRKPKPRQVGTDGSCQDLQQRLIMLKRPIAYFMVWLLRKGGIASVPSERPCRCARTSWAARTGQEVCHH